LGAPDLHAGLALMLDSIVNLSILAGILRGFGFPSQLIYKSILPGSALAALVGNVLYALLAQAEARRTGRTDVTAMPLGLDTPSTIGVALTVLGPAFLSKQQALLAAGVPVASAQVQAGLGAWHLGMALMILVAVIKGACALTGAWVQRHVPPAGLMGSLGGIGLMFLVFLPLIEIFRAPLVGMLAWGIIMVSLVGRRRLPLNLPGVGLAVLVGLAVHYLAGPLSLPGIGTFAWPTSTLSFSPPWPTLAGLSALPEAMGYLPLGLPFALLTVIGGINTCASAQAAGDPYTPRQILGIDALSTLSAALCGGVVQSTPYIGQPAYKRMGARSHYVLFAGLGVGLGGALGAISFAIEAIPLAAVVPILLYVGLEIGRQALSTCPPQHLPAVLLAFLPTLANVLLTRVESLMIFLQQAVDHAAVALGPSEPLVRQMLADAAVAVDLDVLRMLGHGFILTAMLWGGFTAHLIDGQLRRAARLLLVCAGLTAVGLIHSPLANGALFWPWDMPSFQGLGLCIGYCAMAGVLGLLRGSRALA
jgi:AGZA family xanthine/uracil permease-like MFS transporter